MENPAQKSYQLYIDGQWVDASDGGTLDVFCPANGEQLSTIADATKEDVDRAVDAAWKAFETWGKTDKAERAIILNKVADIIEANAEKLALLESLDNGKPIRETRAIDVAYSVDHFRYFAGVLLADTGEADLLPGNMMSLVLHEPIGVVGQIVPWNFPFLMAAWKLAPVLAAGDCTVFKPSSTTSLTVLELAKPRTSSRPACSTWSRAAAASRASTSSTTPRSASSRSPDRPRWAATWPARRPSASSRPRWSWAASPRTSSSPTASGT